jgi:hypothetical protein
MVGRCSNNDECLFKQRIPELKMKRKQPVLLSANALVTISFNATSMNLVQSRASEDAADTATAAL